MRRRLFIASTFTFIALAGWLAAAAAEEEIVIQKHAWQLGMKPTPIAVNGFSGEVDQRSGSTSKSWVASSCQWGPRD